MRNQLSLDSHSSFTGLLAAPIDDAGDDLSLLLMAVAIGFWFAAVGYVRAAMGRPPHPPAPDQHAVSRLAA